MTSSYTSIAPWYDEIFPPDPDTAGFLAAGLAPGSAVLDLACGTGGYALELARRGLCVAGIDLDAAMVARAREKAGPGGPRFEVLDMMAAPARFAGLRFDRIVCVGNSLVHLPDPAAVAGLLAGLPGLLAPGGTLVLQILNYDRILDRAIAELPTIRRPGRLAFARRYRPAGDGRLRFITELTVAEGGGERTIPNETPLLPLRRAGLAAALERAGFRAAAWTGEFDESPWTPDAYATVVRAGIGGS